MSIINININIKNANINIKNYNSLVTKSVIFINKNKTHL